MSNILDLMRAGSVKRFHIVNTIRTQTLAEHQYGVAVLAGEIAERLGLDAPAVASVVAAAIVHDSGETRSGDLPTPTKKKLRRAFGEAFDDILAEFDIPLSLPPSVKTILKCADYLESMIFLMEHKVGRHADVVMDDIMSDAFAFFDRSGDPGRIAGMVWSDMQNAAYEI
jgi:5'-deoxynucleotidase YfbR-like HD superfamily hydrolase